jgi:DEAD/DEAH box helicase domain-containing protein
LRWKYLRNEKIKKEVTNLTDTHMKKFPVIIDLETKHTFRDFNEHEKLGVSVMAMFDYATQKGTVFEEKELNKAFPILENASYVIGYNSNGFDLPVLQAYYPGDILALSTFDLLEDIRIKIGRRLGLNDMAAATLGKKKTGHGLMAIDYYKEGKMEELKKYCLDDVLITKELFEYGVKYGEVQYINEVGRNSIHVEWKQYMEGNGNIQTELTLPF